MPNETNKELAAAVAELRESVERIVRLIDGDPHIDLKGYRERIVALEEIAKSVASIIAERETRLKVLDERIARLEHYRDEAEETRRNIIFGYNAMKWIVVGLSGIAATIGLSPQVIAWLKVIFR